MSEKVSVIIPVYNVEKYLEEAVNSVIKQTYKNIEIILVDDGSKDNSGKMCDELAKNDNRIITIHKKNGGLSDARNAGMEIAKGKYLMFLDSDDYFELDAVENMYKAIEEKNADYVIGNYINVSEKGEKWNYPVFSYEIFKEFKLSIEDSFESFFIMNSQVSNKIFRKEFIDNLQLKFAVGLPAEDAIFTTYCFIKSKNVYYVPKLVFDYRQREGSSISTSCSKDYFSGISKAYKIIYDNFKKNDRLAYYRYFYAKSMNYMIYKLIDSVIINDEEKIEVFKDMMWFYKLSKEIEVSPCQKCTEHIVDKVVNGDFETAIEYCKIIQECRLYMTGQEKEKMSKPDREKYREIEKLDYKYKRK